MFNMASLSDKNYDNPILSHETHHFAEWNFYIVIMKSIKFFSFSFKWTAFHYIRSKDSVPSQYSFSAFYLKLPLEEFHGLLLFLIHVLGSKSICKSHWTLSINPRKKNEWLDLNRILTLIFRFNNLCSIIIYMLT